MADSLFSVIADLHFHEWPDFSVSVEGWNSRLIDQLETLREFMGRPDRGRFCIVAGDVCHTRGRLSYQVGQAVATFFEEACASFERVLVIPGNHDHPLKATDSPVVSLSQFNGFWPNVEIFERPEVVQLTESVHVGLVPWMPSSRWEAEVAALTQPPGSTGWLIGHQLFNGAVASTGKALTSRLALSQELVKDWAGGFFGDVHARQRILGRFWYVGAPYQMTRGEQSEKGFSWVSEDGEIHHTNMAGPFFSQMDVETEDDLDIEDPGFPLYLDVNVNGPVSESVVADRLDFARLQVKRRCEVVEAESPRLSITATDSVAAVFKAYLEEAYTGELDVEALLEQGLEIIEAACGGESDSYSGPVRFVWLTADHFMGFGPGLSVPLEGQGLVLVDGNNRQAPYFRSNATGKSSLVEAIFFALFGRTLRGLKVDELANTAGPGGFTVALQVETAEGVFWIRRSRAHAEFGTGLSILEVTPEGEEDITPGGRGAGAEWVDSHIGISEDVFRAAVLFGQNVEAFFAAADETTQRRILDQLAGTARFDAVAAALKAERKTADAWLEQVRKAVERAEGAQEATAEALLRATASVSEWAATHAEGVQAQAALAAEAVAYSEKLQGRLEEAREALSECDGRALKDLSEDLNAARGAHSRLEGALNGVVAQIEALHEFDLTVDEERLKGAKHALDKAHERRGAAFSERGRLQGVLDELVSRESAEAVVAECTQALESATVALARAEGADAQTFMTEVVAHGASCPCPVCEKPVSVAAARKKLSNGDALAPLRQAVEAARSDLQEAQALLRSITEAENNLRAARAEVSHSDEAVRMADSAFEEAKRALAAMEQRVEEAQSRRSELEARRSDLRVEVEEAAALLGDTQRAQEAFSEWSRERSGKAAAVTGLEHTAADQAAQAEREAATLARLRASVNPYSSQVEAAQAAATKAATELESAQADVGGAEELVLYLQELAVIFGNQGLKTFVFDAMAPQLQTAANRALMTLVDGDIQLKMGSKRGTSTLRERLCLEVVNVNGADSYKGDSGGERRMVDIGLLLALHAQAHGRFNLIKMDEAVAPLDSTACLRVMALLSEWVEGGQVSTILFTSHREELKELFDRVWVMHRSGKQTTCERLN